MSESSRKLHFFIILIQFFLEIIMKRVICVYTAIRLGQRAAMTALLFAVTHGHGGLANTEPCLFLSFFTPQCLCTISITRLIIVKIKYYDKTDDRPKVSRRSGRCIRRLFPPKWPRLCQSRLLFSFWEEHTVD